MGACATGWISALSRRVAPACGQQRVAACQAVRARPSRAGRSRPCEIQPVFAYMTNRRVYQVGRCYIGQMDTADRDPLLELLGQIKRDLRITRWLAVANLVVWLAILLKL